MATPIAEGPGYRPAGYRRVDRVAARDSSILFRVVAAIAATAMLVFGLVALARIAWGDGGLDAAAVDVADVTFTPVVAIATAALGLVALIAAATPGRTSKIVIGALLIAVGIVAFVVTPDTDRVIVEDAHAWMSVILGVVLVIAALAMSWGTGRVVETDAVYDDTVV